MHLPGRRFFPTAGGHLRRAGYKNPRISVNKCGNGDWIRCDSVSFLNGEYDSLSLYYFCSWPQDASNGYVRVQVDSPTGTVIATFSGLGNQRAVQGEPSAHQDTFLRNPLGCAVRPHASRCRIITSTAKAAATEET